MNTRTALACLLLVVGSALLPAAGARADTSSGPPKWTWKRDLVVLGTVAEITGDEALISIERVLQGRLSEEAVRAGPTDRATCRAVRVPTLAAGERVILFLERGDGKMRITGRVSLTHERYADSLAGVEELLRSPVEEGSARDAAMVRAGISDSEYARDISHWYVRIDMDGPETAFEHEDGLLAMLRSEHPEARFAALHAFADARSPRAFPVIRNLALTAGAQPARQACRALAPYDRDDAVETILAVSRRRGMAHVVQTLGYSPRPQAVGLLRDRLRSPQTEMRTAAVNGLTARFKAGDVDEAALDILLELSSHPQADGSQIPLSDALRAARSPRTVRKMLDALSRPSIPRVSEWIYVRALYCLFEVEPMPEARREITSRVGVLIGRLDAGEGTDLRTVWLVKGVGTRPALDALRRAAKSHPDEETRDRAREYLAQD